MKEATGDQTGYREFEAKDGNANVQHIGRTTFRLISFASLLGSGILRSVNYTERRSGFR